MKTTEVAPHKGRPLLAALDNGIVCGTVFMGSTLERTERIAGKTLAMDGSLERERDESGLIGKICQGQTELFQTLIKPYERTVFAVAYSVMNNGADAEDVAQEAFLNALKG
jgi:hypothetical protein